jgi:hypothetical protein
VNRITNFFDDFKLSLTEEINKKID